MAKYSRATPTGWSQGDDASGALRATPTGWEQIAASVSATTVSGTIVESTSDTTSGAISFKHYVSGTVTESTADTTAGTVSFKHLVSGTVTESTQDTTAGTVSFKHYVSGTVTESINDTTAGTVTVNDDASYVSGTITESTQDTTAGTVSFKHYVSGTVTESTSDTTSGTVSFNASTVSGTVTESTTDTTAGAVSFKHYVSGTITESSRDTTSGTVNNLEAEVRTGGGISKNQKKRKLRHTKKKEIDEQLEALILDLQNDKKLPKEVIQEVKREAEKVIIKQGEIPSLEGIKELLQELLPKEPTITDVSRQLQTIQTAIGELMQEIRYVKKYTKSLEELIIILNNDD